VGKVAVGPNGTLRRPIEQLAGHLTPSSLLPFS
jgi:hypothetical protein